MIGTVNFITERTIVAFIWAFANFAVWVVVTAYLFRQARLNIIAAHSFRRGVRTAYQRVGNQAAVAIWWYMLGEAGARIWGALLIAVYATGGDIAAIESRYPFALIFSLIAMVGALCKVRVFSPEAIREWLWIAVAATGLALALLVAIVLAKS